MSHFQQSVEELNCGEHKRHEDGFVCVCNEGYELESDGKTCSGVANLYTTLPPYIVGAPLISYRC